MCAVLAGLVLAAPPGAAAVDVAVVLEPAVAPYVAALEGFREGCGCTVRTYTPEQARDAGFDARLRLREVAAVVALGKPARDAVERLRGLPVLAAMSPRVDLWTAAAPDRLGVELALAPARHLAAIRLVFPGARRVGVLFDPAVSGDYAAAARGAAAAAGPALVARAVARPADVPKAVAALAREADVLWLLPDPTVLGAENLEGILLTSFQARLPIHAFARKYVELGAVAALHPDPGALGRQAAALLARRLAGGPGQAWEYAAAAELVLNARVGRKMGVAFPAGALEEAADVLR